MTTRGQPLEKSRLVVGQLDPCHAGLLKTQLQGQLVESTPEMSEGVGGEVLRHATGVPAGPRQYTGTR